LDSNESIKIIEERRIDLMKKLLLLVVVAVLALTVAAQASSVSFSWGAVFTNFANSNIKMPVGTSGQVEWFADDFGFGLASDSVAVSGYSYSTGNIHSSTISTTELIADKWLSKSVAVGIGLGSCKTTYGSHGSTELFRNGGSFPLVDIRGAVQLLSGKGEKVNASLDFNLAARYVTTSGLQMMNPATNGRIRVPNLNATVATLAVTLGL